MLTVRQVHGSGFARSPSGADNAIDGGGARTVEPVDGLPAMSQRDRAAHGTAHLASSQAAMNSAIRCRLITHGTRSGAGRKNPD